jgi:carbamate kinase
MMPTLTPGGYMKNMRRYSVIVGNIGQVYEGNNAMQARAAYKTYIAQSKASGLRASGEPVTLFDTNEIKAEYFGTLEDNR